MSPVLKSSCFTVRARLGNCPDFAHSSLVERPSYFFTKFSGIVSRN